MEYVFTPLPAQVSNFGHITKKTAVLVHIVDINLMVVSKRNMFAFLKYIYCRLYMPQLLWEQGRICIGWELYHEKALKFKEYIYIVLT